MRWFGYVISGKRFFFFVERQKSQNIERLSMLIACLLWNDFLFDVKRAYRITTNTPVSIYIHNNNWSFKKSDFFFLFRFLAKYSILFNRSSYISDFIKGFGFSLSLFLPASFHFYYNLFEKKWFFVVPSLILTSIA